MISGYSRMRWAMMIASRQAADLIAGHWQLIQAIGAVPRQLVWENEGAVGCWRRGTPTLTAEFENFRGSLGIGVHLCRPRDPEAKGLTERNNGYFETSFLPGREFTGPEDFNSQFGGWLGQANARHSRRIGCAPTARWSTDRDAMLLLPPAAPAVGWRNRVRLPRDYYVRIASNDYSVDPAVVGRFVDLVADGSTNRSDPVGRVRLPARRCRHGLEAPRGRPPQWRGSAPSWVGSRCGRWSSRDPREPGSSRAPGGRSSPRPTPSRGRSW